VGIRPGKVKTLIVDYRLNGQPYRLFLQEQYPVAFTVKIPSPEAEAPDMNPEATATMQNVSTAANRQASAPAQYSQPPRLCQRFHFCRRAGLFSSCSRSSATPKSRF